MLGPYRLSGQRDRTNRTTDTSMQPDTTESPNRMGEDAETSAGLAERARRAVSKAARHGHTGTVLGLAGGALLARAIGSRGRNSRSAAVQALAGVGLLGLGLRRRRAAPSQWNEEQDSIARHGVTRQPDTNPRGTSEEPPVETATASDEGEVRFSDEQITGPRSEPHLADRREDPRIDEEGDSVDVDLSEAALADEASEATGPAPEQAQPASTEETEPERTPSDDVSHVQADEPASDEGSEGVSGDPLERDAIDPGTERSEMEESVGRDDAEEGDERPDEDAANGRADEDAAHEDAAHEDAAAKRADEDESDETWDAGELEDRPEPDEDEDDDSELA